MWNRVLRALPDRCIVHLQGRPGGSYDESQTGWGWRSYDDHATRPTVAVWKFASCDGCQLTCSTARTSSCDRRRHRHRLLPGGDASRTRRPVRPVDRRGLDHHAARRRARSRTSALSTSLITIGACATAAASRHSRTGPMSTSSLDRVRPPRVHRDAVDLDARSPTTCRSTSSCGAARSRRTAHRGHRCVRARPQAARPPTPCAWSASCEATTCVMVSHGTRAGTSHPHGCGALCPAFNAGCYGCFGPSESPNSRPSRGMARHRASTGPDLRRAALDVQRLRTEFREASEDLWH